MPSFRTGPKSCICRQLQPHVQSFSLSSTCFISILHSSSLNQFHSAIDPTAISIPPHSSTSIVASLLLIMTIIPPGITLIPIRDSGLHQLSASMTATNIFPNLSCFGNPLIITSSFVRLTPSASCSVKKEIVSKKNYSVALVKA